MLNLETNIDVNELQVFNLLGQKVIDGYKTKSINVSTLSEGTYFLKILETNNSVFKTIRFIKN